MKYFKKVAAILFTMAVVAGAVGCGKNEADKEKTSNDNEELKTINVGVPATETKLTIENSNLADSLGYFEEELKSAGYELNIIGFGSGGTAVNEAFASGEIDLAFMGDVPEVIGRSNGLDIQIFAALNTNSTLSLLAGKNSGIQSVEDLKGKKVVIAYGTVTHKYLSDILKDAGMTLDDVDTINDISNAATLVASGDADALVLPVTATYMYEANGIGDVILTSRGNESQSAQFFVAGRTDFMEENPDAVKGIMKALIRAKDYAAANPDEVAKAFETDAVSEEIWKKVYPVEDGFEMFNPEITDSSKEKLEELAEFLYDEKIITNKIDVEAFVNTEYYEEVAKELGIK